MSISNKVIKRIDKKYIYLLFIVAIATGVSFFKCSSQNLRFAGPWNLDLVEYEEKARYDNWDNVIKKTEDPFLIEGYSNKEELIFSKNLYNYSNFPAYLFYKLLHLRGVDLWLAQRFLMFYLYILTILLVYLIAVEFYPPFISFTAGILTAFSPHIWIPFQIDGNPNRAYNILTSMIVVYLFLLFLKREKGYFILLAGIFMGVNFLFFHIGSFIIPLIIFIYCVYLSFIKKNLFYITRFISIAFIAVCSALILMHLHSTYFKLQHNMIYIFIKQYIAFGPATSHSVDGMVFFNWQNLLLNIKNFIGSVFINGKSRDWHYLLSPPGIPMVYNYLISVFFLVGCLISIRERKREDMFFFIWFSTFFVIYSMVIEVRPKNIMWMLPAVFVLSSRAVPLVGSFCWRTKESKWMRFFISKISMIPVGGNFLRPKINTASERKFIRCVFIFLIASSVCVGSFIIFYHLPKRNFYDGEAYMGNYHAYKYLSEQGYSDSTKIIFTMPEVTVGNTMLRLFTQKIPEIICLSQNGVQYPPKEEDWKKLELSLLKNSDKIFYCFTYWHNRQGHIYITDEHYRDVFKKIHPEIEPFIIYGLDGEPIWRIYEINSEDFM